MDRFIYFSLKFTATYDFSLLFSLFLLDSWQIMTFLFSSFLFHWNSYFFTFYKNTNVNAYYILYSNCFFFFLSCELQFWHIYVNSFQLFLYFFLYFQGFFDFRFFRNSFSTAIVLIFKATQLIVF